MRWKCLLFAIVCVFSTLGCSIFDNEQTAPVTAVIQQEQLIIKNNLPFNVYYFAVDQASLPYIFWVPIISEQNILTPGTFVSIPTNQFFRQNNHGPVVVFYWDEEISEIFNILIE